MYFSSVSGVLSSENITLEAIIKNVEIILQDERLTTMGAERVLLEANVSRKKRKNVIDKMAAVLILQTYLDKLN